VHYLQTPQSVGEQEKNKQYDVLHGGEADGGDFFLVTEHQFPIIFKLATWQPLMANRDGLEEQIRIWLYFNPHPRSPEICGGKPKFAAETP
jgi:hypothetical protein